MDKSYFIKLLRKYRQGSASIEECKFLLRYYEMFDAEPDIVAMLSDEQKLELKNQLQEGIWSDINRSKGRMRRNIFWRRMTKGMAAAAVLVFCILGFFYFLVESPESKNAAKAIGKVEKMEEHRLIRLPDGSTVILYAGSKLNYPSSFDGFEKREVYLEGEAYFDVKHNDKKPFIVHAGKLETTVLGTEFNIKAWPEEIDISVTVARGKVRVDDNMNKTLGVVTLNEQLTYNKEAAEARQRKVNTTNFIDWREGDLLFDDVTISEASELLEERFNVEIVCKDALIWSKRFTTTFLKHETLEQVLESICTFNGAVYHYDKEKSLITISSEHNKK